MKKQKEPKKEMPCHVKHPKEIIGFKGTIDDLVFSIGNTTYDTTIVFLDKLSKEYTRQANADEARGRTQLAEQLYSTAQKLYEARDAMQKAWNICKPYMQR